MKSVVTLVGSLLLSTILYYSWREPIVIAPESRRLQVSTQQYSNTVRIRIKNNLSRSINIIGMHAPCGCMSAEVPFCLGAMEEKFIEFRMDATGYKESFEEEVEVTFFSDVEGVSGRCRIEIEFDAALSANQQEALIPTADPNA